MPSVPCAVPADGSGFPCDEPVVSTSSGTPASESSGPPVVRLMEQFLRILLSTAPRSVIEAVAVSTGLGLTEGAGLLLLVPLLGLVGIDTGQRTVSGILARVTAAFEWAGLQPTLPVILTVYVVIVAAQSMLQRREATLSASLMHDVVQRLRQRIYRAIAAARWTYLATTRASDYTHVLTEEVNRVGVAAHLVVDVAAGGAVVLAYVVLAARVSPAMTILVALSGGLLGLVVRPLVIGAMQRGKEYSSASNRLHAAVTEHLASIKMAKGYGIEARHTAIFDEMARDLGEVNRATVSGYAHVKQLLAISSAVLLACIVYFAYGVLGISAGSLLLLLFLFGRLVPRVTSLYERAQTIASEVAALDHVLEIERRCLAAAERISGAQEPIVFADRVELSHVAFAYGDDGRSPALEDASLVVPAGTTTAIVGGSGAGKSTVADLLLGLLEPSSGRVLVDGVPLGPERLAAWRARIGYVAQDAFLFHDTIAANLRWARPGAVDDDLWEALRLAAADGFVRALPLQLETVLGDRGVLLSGGERQRLSLARALLRHPALLVLDEPTSALDSENEQRIQDAIEGLHERMTIVIITHRLSTIRNADLIHVLEQGRVVESGSWADLTRPPDTFDGAAGLRVGRFRELCEAQGVDVDSTANSQVPSGTRP
jgi:ATP-binding cassette subfamily C protein